MIGAGRRPIGDFAATVMDRPQGFSFAGVMIEAWLLPLTSLSTKRHDHVQDSIDGEVRIARDRGPLQRLAFIPTVISVGNGSGNGT